MPEAPYITYQSRQEDLRLRRIVRRGAKLSANAWETPQISVVPFGMVATDFWGFTGNAGQSGGPVIPAKATEQVAH